VDEDGWFHVVAIWLAITGVMMIIIISGDFNKLFYSIAYGDAS
jgi:hypothetical protein